MKGNKVKQSNIVLLTIDEPGKMKEAREFSIGLKSVKLWNFRHYYTYLSTFMIYLSVVKFFFLLQIQIPYCMAMGCCNKASF